MSRMMKRILQILVLLCWGVVSAQEVQDSVKIHFRQGSSELDLNLGGNRAVLDSITEKLQLKSDDSIYYRLRKVLVVGGASPEGSIAVNRNLSEKRAETLFEYLSRYGTFSDSIRHSLFLGRDWKGLARLVGADSAVPYRDEVLGLLKDISVGTGNKQDDVWRLKALRGGKPYSYMYRHLFPLLRSSSMYLWYSEVKLPPFSAHTSLQKSFVMSVPQLEMPPFVLLPIDESEKSFHVALKTNLLYDLATALNYSIEIPFSKNFSVLFQHHFPWWEKGNKYCLQLLTLGGELRWWFAPKELPASIARDQKSVLLGHFLGVHGWSGKGDVQWKRKFGCYQFEFWSAGLTYGYAMPISKYFNLEFSLSAGYARIPYQHYIPTEDWEVLVRDENKKGTLDYWGLTKAEVSLVLPIKIKMKKK